MLKTMIGAIGCAAAIMLSATAPAQTLFRPVAIVNDSAITAYDVTQRERIMVALGFQAPSAEALRAAAMDQLVEDRLKTQEARRGGLVATDADIEAGIAETAKNFNTTPEPFLGRLRAAGVDESAIRDMIAASVIWRDMVRQRFAARVEPGEAEIDAEIALMQQRATTSYRLAEIGLPLVERGRSEPQTRELADRLYESLNAGGDFAAAARRYSRSPSGPRGGEIGWVPAERMPITMAQAIAELEPGQVTRPIAVPGGLSLIKVQEVRTEAAEQVDAADPELRERVRSSLANQQISRLAEGLLQDLRRDSLIETR